MSTDNPTLRYGQGSSGGWKILTVGWCVALVDDLIEWEVPQPSSGLPRNTRKPEPVGVSVRVWRAIRFRPADHHVVQPAQMRLLTTQTELLGGIG